VFNLITEIKYFNTNIGSSIPLDDFHINFTCLVVNLPPDIISSVTELCVLGILFQQEKLIFSLSTVLEQA